MNPKKKMPWLGGTRSEETKRKISETLKGRKFSKEQCENISIALTGKKQSEETSEKKRQSMRKLYESGFINPNIGRKHSAESKEKIGAAQRGEKHHLFGTHKTDEEKRNISEKISGDKHYNWQGGKSFEEYGPGFNNALKKIIRARYNYECKLCFKHQDDMYDKNGDKYSLIVHHINYDKRNSSESNLICLCRNCHAKTNFKRDDWTSFFQGMVNNNESI